MARYLARVSYLTIAHEFVNFSIHEKKGNFERKEKRRKKEKETAFNRSSRPSRGEEKNGERRERMTGYPGVGISMRAGSES